VPAETILTTPARWRSISPPRTNCVTVLTRARSRSAKLGVSEFLSLPAEDEVNAAGEGLQGLPGRVHVGRLESLKNATPRTGGHKLQAVLDGLKLETDARIDSAETRQRAAQTAARTFSTLCAPLSGSPPRALQAPAGASRGR